MKRTLQERQQQMMAHLLHGDAAIGAYIAKQGAVDTATRLHIYRNAYRTRLRESLDVDHPVLGIYLGDDLFAQMVADYRTQYPSKHRSLRHYAAQLPEFLARCEPFSESPQIAELARFERLLLSAFDAADAQRVGAERLQALSPADWPTMTLEFHPSVQLFESDWNAVSLWQALKEGATPPVPAHGLQAWVLWRNRDLLTEFRALDRAEYRLCKTLLAGRPLAAACEALLDGVAEEQVSAVAAASLLRWIDMGLVHRINSSGAPQAASAAGEGSAR